MIKILELAGEIEEGSVYRTFGGRRAGPMRRSNDEDFPWEGDVSGMEYPQQWKANGRFLDSGRSGLDVVERLYEAGGQANAAADPYAPLRAILDAALAQASEGKGKERHANGKPFLEQPIMGIGRMVGPGGHAYQIAKKAQEAVGMASRGEYASARAECLGAIVYAAAMAMLMDEMAGDAA